MTEIVPNLKTKSMPIEHRLSWNAVLRDMRSDRARVAIGVVSVRSLIRGLVCIRRTSLVTLTGAFNRAALIVAAVEAAKAHQLRTGAAWSVSMSIGLTAAWQAAKAARLSAVVREQGRFKRAQQPVHRDNLLTVSAAEGEGRAIQGGDPSPTQSRWAAYSPAQLLRAAQAQLSA